MAMMPRLLSGLQMDQSNSDSDEDWDMSSNSSDLDYVCEAEVPFPHSHSSTSSIYKQDYCCDANDEAGPSHSTTHHLVEHFIGMGFPENLVADIIKQSDEDMENILDRLLVYIDTADCSKDRLLSTLVEMGFSVDYASSAIDRCGTSASILELADSIEAARTAENVDYSTSSCIPNSSRRIKDGFAHAGEKRKRDDLKKKYSLKQGEDDKPSLIIPNPMIGFGLPNERKSLIHRYLPEDVVGPPYFYYENVALTPKGAWEKISRFLYEVEPEFVDSKYFSAAARKRGYVHNLPIENRFPLLPLPPQTIQEALPHTRKWWPSWDKRTHLNCLQTSIACSTVTDKIGYELRKYGDAMPSGVRQNIIDTCRKWNLLWVGYNRVATLEPHEIEMLLGFPKDHTRGGGISRTDRYKSLGNSFQVDTVAYHLSVLKDIFPYGIRVLSLFSGIGGAEVVLDRLGIPLNTVVSVETSAINRNILRAWWEQTKQTGNLIEFPDIRLLESEHLCKLIRTCGGFDLVIGGSPCNNLTGNNRFTRDGLDGKHSILFYDYFRILGIVRCMMGKGWQFVFQEAD